MRKFTTVVATVAASLALSLAPAQAAPTTLGGMFLGGDNTVANLSCDELKTLLEQFEVLSPEDTRASLESKINLKIDALGATKFIPGSELLKGKLVSDIGSKADECSLVKKDPASQLSAQLGLPDLGPMLPLLTSASSAVAEK